MRSKASRNVSSGRAPMNSAYKNSRRKPRKRHRGVGRFVLIMVFLCVVVVGGFIGFKLLTKDSYSDAESFQAYAERMFDSIGGSHEGVESETEFDYGKPASVAVDRPITSDEYLDEEIDSFIDTARASYEGKYGIRDTNEKYAQVFAFESLKNDQNTTSLLLRYIIQSENKDGSMEMVSEKVRAINFNSDNKSELVPFIVFKPGYQQEVTKLLTSEVEKQYGDDLNKDYKKYLTSSSLLKRFTLDGNDVVFHFDAGSIVPESEGAVSVKLTGDDAKSVMREKINERNLDPNKPMVAITYDDGPAAGLTERVINAYEKADGACTFFQLGQNVAYVDGASEILKKAEAAGCELGSHSWDHTSFVGISDKAVKEQKEKADKAFIDAVGHAPTLYRPPYGAGNDNTTKIFGKAGILWSVDTMDWQNRNADAVVDAVKNVDNLDGKVVLLHDIHPTSVEATEKFVPWLKEQGYQLVTVSELLAYKYKKDPSIPEYYGYGYFIIPEE